MIMICKTIKGEYLFNFDSYAEFCEEIELINMPQLYFIEFDDGDREDLELLDAAKDEMPGILESFFEFCESGSREEKAAMYYLLEEKSMAWNEALEKIDEVQVSDLTLKQSAEEFFFDVYDVPKSIEIYIDIEKFAHDCEVSGDFFEFELAGCTYTITNNGCF